MRIKVLYLITELDVGGAERVVYEIATRLDRDRFEILVAYLTGSGEVGGWIEGKGIKVWRRPAGEKPGVRTFWWLLKLLKKERPDILHCHLFHANIVGRVVGRAARVPFVISTTHVMETDRVYRLWLDGLSSLLINKEVCVSHSVRHFVRRAAHIPYRKLITIHNGLDFDRFQVEVDIQGKRRELGLERFADIVVCVGRLHRQKGQAYLIRAAAEVLRKHPDTGFLFIGEGPMRDELRGLVSRLKLEKNVLFCGFRADVPEVLNACDIFVLPSLWEGFGLAAAEANASGLPVLATRVDGLPEVVIDGETGVIIPPSDAGAIRDVLLELLGNPEKRKKMGDSGREWVRENFSVGLMVKKTEALYGELAG